MPDWKKKSDYPFSEKTSPEEWAWEFLKRNPDYQNDHADMLATYENLEKDHGPRKKWNKKTIKDDPRACIYDPPKMKGESDNQWIERCLNKNIFPHRYYILRGLGIKWGLEESYDPKREYSKTIKFTPSFNSKYPQKINALKINNLNDLIEDNSEDDLRVIEGKVLLAFDLATSIKDQITKASKELNALKKKLKKKLPSHKLRPDIWTNYLRIYDAVNSKIKYSDIAKELYTQEYKSYGNKRKNAIDKVREQFKRAEEFVMKDYKNIFLMRPKVHSSEKRSSKEQTPKEQDTKSY